MSVFQEWIQWRSYWRGGQQYNKSNLSSKHLGLCLVLCLLLLMMEILTQRSKVVTAPSPCNKRISIWRKTQGKMDYLPLCLCFLHLLLFGCRNYWHSHSKELAYVTLFKNNCSPISISKNTHRDIELHTQTQIWLVLLQNKTKWTTLESRKSISISTSLYSEVQCSTM